MEVADRPYKSYGSGISNYRTCRKMRNIVLLIFLLVSGNASAQFRIGYFGNMGVSISRNDSAVFIDAFHDYYKDAYQPTFPSKLDAVTGKKELYKHAIAAMVTHYHDDHMDPGMLEKVLNAQAAMKLIGGTQVTERIDTNAVNRFQLITVGKEQVIKIAPGVFVTAVKTWHVNYYRAARFASTDNFFYLVEWDGRRFLHLGDTELVDRNFAWMEKWKGSIDVLFAPTWIVNDPNGVHLIQRYVEPKQTVILHVDPSTQKSEIASRIPARIFSESDDALLIE